MKIRTLQTALVDATFSLAGLASLGFGLYFMANKELPLAVTALGAGLVLLLAATIDRFESLKGLGMEAKTRTLKETINQAQVAIDQLKDLAELTGGTLLSMTSAVGRWDAAPSVAEAHKLSRQVLRILQGLGSSQEVIRAALLPWARAAAMDLFQAQLQRLHELISARVSELDAEKINLSSPEQLNFAMRAQEAAAYPGVYASRLQEWDLHEYEIRVLEMFDGAPLLDDEARAKSRPEFVVAAAEFSFLASNLDFRNKTLWSRVRQPV